MAKFLFGWQKFSKIDWDDGCTTVTLNRWTVSYVNYKRKKNLSNQVKCKKTSILDCASGTVGVQGHTASLRDI